MRISPLKQLVLTATIAIIFLVWLGMSLSALAEHVRLASERASLQAHSQEIQVQDRNLRHNRRQLDERTRTLETRQRQLERIVQQYLGIEFSRPPAKVGQAADPAPIDQRLALIEQRQLGFASEVTRTTSAQQAQQRNTFRRLGLPSPPANGGDARGGPFIPYDGPVPTGAAPSPDQLFAGLRYSLGQWQASKGFLAALPVGHPVSTIVMSSPFGVRDDPFTHRPAAHMGQDFRGPMGDPIMAAGEGRVTHAGWLAGYGKAVMVDHGYHLVSLYGHLSSILVRDGQEVRRGDRLGLMGSTGRSTGTHLHFEVRLNGRSINPRPLMEMNLVR